MTDQEISNLLDELYRERVLARELGKWRDKAVHGLLAILNDHDDEKFNDKTLYRRLSNFIAEIYDQALFTEPVKKPGIWKRISERIRGRIKSPPEEPKE